MMKAVALLLALLPALIRAQTTGDCDLDCYFNTSCVPGSNTIDGQPLDINNETISPNGWHCGCPDGLTGLRCERTYVGCKNSDHECYNGGECIPGVKDIYGNEQEFCDCANAVDMHGIKYVGKYCEIPVPMACGDDDSVFCVNGGYCKEDFADEPQRPCQCGKEYDGPHCEYTKGHIPNCTLECENDGQCQLGIKTYEVAEFSYQSFWGNSTDDFMHCLCPQGFFGLYCEVEAQECGDHHCFNGGTCVTVESEGSMDFHCECTSANTEYKSYAGRFCQYESSSFCEKSTDPDGRAFCVNGGQCKEEYGITGCMCPEGFHGPICEFSDDEENGDYEDCSLQCNNGGECRNGVKDVSFLGLFNLGPVVSNLNMTHNADFEHCVCPDGYVGLTCDIGLTSCGDDSHICLYGSKCVEDSDGYTCDCDDSHNGCGCPEGFSGDNCEKVGESMATSISGSGGSSNKGKAAFASTLSTCLVALVGTIAFAVMIHKKRSSKPVPIVVKADPTPPTQHDTAPQVDAGPENGLDRNQMENFELV